MLQETCYFEWQNLIAEASRRGYVGEEELQWNSYKILDEQLEQEWLQSVEQRKNMPRPKGSKRAPKSPEQRRKISEAISAKWADPVSAYKEFLEVIACFISFTYQRKNVSYFLQQKSVWYLYGVGHRDSLLRSGTHSCWHA